MTQIEYLKLLLSDALDALAILDTNPEAYKVALRRAMSAGAVAKDLMEKEA